MRTCPSRSAFHGLLMLLILAGIANSSAQYMEVSAQIEYTEWRPKGVKVYPWTLQCIVGTNSWQMNGDFTLNAATTYWFTGSNIVEYAVVTTELSKELSKFETGSPVGTEILHVCDSEDGNPGTLSGCGPHDIPFRRGPDCLCALGRIGWLAFCSGPCLKSPGRHIFPPSDLWKDLVCAPAGFSDETTVFDDTLGLPKTIELHTPTAQPIMQYRVTFSTNVLGWELPTKFMLAQYRPAFSADGRGFSTNTWELDLTA